MAAQHRVTRMFMCGFDTYQIAGKIGITEAEVYNILANRTKVTKRRSVRKRSDLSIALFTLDNTQALL
jgi:plasmid maintenance system antidote protein VapI